MSDATQLRCVVCGDPIEDEENDTEEDGVKVAMCSDCRIMIAVSQKNRDEELGAGPIKTKRGKQWLAMEPWQQVQVICDEATPQFNYHFEGEREFTDVDLLRLSVARVKSILTRKGFNVDFEEAEDIAGGVIGDFLETMADETAEIENIHAYHWAMCKNAVNKWMAQYIDRRLATVEQDVLDFAEAYNIRDPYNWGAVSSIAEHERVAPQWVSVNVDGAKVMFEGAGLTEAEGRTLLNAMKGENKGLKGKQSTRRKIQSALNKLETNVPETYQTVRELMGVK